MTFVACCVRVHGAGKDSLEPPMNRALVTMALIVAGSANAQDAGTDKETVVNQCLADIDGGDSEAVAAASEAIKQWDTMIFATQLKQL